MTNSLRDLRHSANLTQTQMATLLGMSLRAIQDLEGGHTPVRQIHILAAERAVELNDKAPRRPTQRR